MVASDWDRAAEAWIAAQGDTGDFSRAHVLDPAILPLIRQGGYRRALDVGCGEGRFCRLLQTEGINTVGLDPTKALLAEARRRDPNGTYVEGVAQDLQFQSAAFDFVVSYLTLIDVPDFRAAISEMARVLVPGGTLMVANITGFRTAMVDQGWVCDGDGQKLHYPVDRYMEERDVRVDWLGTTVANWHRPLSAYMQAFLAEGLILTYFDNPPAVGGTAAEQDSYRRAPWLVLMTWKKGPL